MSPFSLSIVSGSYIQAALGGRTGGRVRPTCPQCAGAHRNDFLLLLPELLPARFKIHFCGVGADWRTHLSDMSAVRGSAPERFSFAYFSFPQKEK